MKSFNRRERPAAAVLLTVLGLMHLLLLGTLSGHDYQMFVATARALMAHAPAYEPETTPAGMWRNLLPPNFHVMLLPAVWLPYSGGLALWRLANAALFAAAVAVVTPPRSTSIAARWWIAALATNVAASAVAVYDGQVAGVLAFGVVVGWLGASKGKWVLSAAIWGALCSAKPFLGLLAIWYVRRRGPGILAVGLGSACAMWVAGILAFGVQATLDWLEALRAVDWTWSPMNASLYGFWSRVFAEPVAISLWSVSAAAVTLWTTKRLASGDDDVRALASLSMASILVSPLGWIYYLWLPLPFLVAHAVRTHTWPRSLLLLCAPAPLVHLGPPDWWVIATLGSAYTWGLLGTWWWTCQPAAAVEGRSASTAQVEAER